MSGAAIVIERVCTEFESRWRAGERPDIAGLLSHGSPEDRERLLRELLLLEIELRAGEGETPSARDYLDELAEYAHVVATVFRQLEHESTVVTSYGHSRRPEHGAVPNRVAHFELHDVLGHGGMGVVYRARDTSLDRWVALKMIGAGRFPSSEAVERFGAEAAAAARLDHPNIVPVYEAGKCDDQHYISMALVDGPSLQAAMADGPCDPRRAAELLEPVCRAIHHAHEHGVIHRDLKPANILLTPNGRPRITDFGLAKHMGDDRHLTVTHQLLGTPGYMSPEQAAGQGSTATPATDVYALGAVLYWLLTGRPPFQAATLAATIRQVAERDPVPPRQLNPDIPRDLETLALRCLVKDPHQRLPSAAELADELERFLRGEPIRSRPISRATRAWRWARRNPAVAGLAAALVFALVAGSAVSLALGYRANRHARAALFEAGRATQALGRAEEARIAADHEADRANSIRDYLLLDMLRAAGPENLGPDVTVAQVLDLAAARAGSRFEGRPELEAAVRHVVGQTSMMLGRLDDASEQFALADAVYQDLYAPDHVRRLDLASARGVLETLMGRPEAALERLAAVEQLALERHAADEPITIGIRLAIGDALQVLGRHGEAQPVLRRVVEQSAGRDETAPVYYRALSSLAGSLVATGALDEAEGVYRLWLEASRKQYGDEHLATASAIGNLASLLVKQQRLEEAEPLHRQCVETLERVLAEGDWQTAMARGNWGVCLRRLGRFDDAAVQLTACCESLERVLGDGDYKTQVYLGFLGQTHADRQLWSEAIECERRILVGRLGAHGPGEHGPIHQSFEDLVKYAAQSAGADDPQCVIDDVTFAVESLADDDPRRIRAMLNWGSILNSLDTDYGRERAARAMLRNAARLAYKHLGPDHPDTRWAEKLKTGLDIARTEAPHD